MLDSAGPRAFLLTDQASPSHATINKKEEVNAGENRLRKGNIEPDDERQISTQL